jgi:hypothetical protein
MPGLHKYVNIESKSKQRATYVADSYWSDMIGNFRDLRNRPEKITSLTGLDYSYASAREGRK